MISSILIKSLITKIVRTSTQVTIEGSKMILNERSDFENEEELLNTMKNSNIDTIRLEGSSITSLPKFSGIQLVETFECFLSCEIPESYFHHNIGCPKVRLAQRSI